MIIIPITANLFERRGRKATGLSNHFARQPGYRKWSIFFKSSFFRQDFLIVIIFRKGATNVNLFPQSFQSLEQAMSTATLKQRVHTANIANVDTPNYKSKQVSFQSALDTAIHRQPLASFKTEPQHIAFSTETGESSHLIKENNSTKITPNGNNVDMDSEMAELAKNQLWYNALTERVNGKFNSLRSVIDGR